MSLSLCALFAGVGESQPRQVESWFREGLRTNLTVEGCGSPQLACPWHVPTLPIPLPGWWP